jgi:light-regulated signal transduction histidine kinase (bacteriophytochrome)
MARRVADAGDKAAQLGALQDRVASLTAELEAAHGELEAFSYSVSHDLRAPVRHIDGFLRLLQEELGTPSPKAAHYLATLAGAARRLGALIDDLLAYSRAARQPLKLRPVDLGALVREVVARCAHDAPGTQWEIGELPWVSADRGQLRIVLQQLLDNARKFTAAQPRPRIVVRARPAAGRDVAVSVSDNGVGFDPRLAGRLFGVFQRLHREEDFAGNGIGLATARRILHRHGQRIWGEGAPGKGAVFTFTLRTAAAG